MRRSLMLLGAGLLALPLAPLSAQQATSSAASDRPIPEWLVLGTFPVDTGAQRVRKDYIGGEAQVAATAGERAAGKVWRTAGSDQRGRLNLNDVYELPHEQAAGYALAYIVSPADRTIVMGVESDDDGVIWLNGQQVYFAQVARGVSQTDTITLRLAKGANRLLFKIVNRSGGFGVGARLLALSPDRIDDLQLSAARPALALADAPAPWVTLSPAKVGSQGRLADGQLLVDVSMDVARWGGVRDTIRLQVGTRTLVAPESPSGLPVRVSLKAAWPELAALLQQPRITMQWGSQQATSSFPLAAGDLLSVLSRVLVAEGWQKADAAGAWSALGTSPDTSARALRLQLTVPAVLAGLTLHADVAEYVPGAAFLLNGVAATPDARERLTLCGPCAAGQKLELAVQLSGDQWWDPPRLRVAEIGWRELADGARYARVLRHDSTIAVPDEASARALLPLAASPDKRAYLAQLEQLRAPLRALEPALREDTLDLVGNSHIDAAWLWRWPETVDVVRNTWRTAVKLLDKYPEMKFAASSARYYTWLEEYEPELLAKIQQLQDQGRWIVTGGWWVEPDVNTPMGESLVRQGLYGQRTIMRLFGEPATVAWIPDTFGYPFTLPQLFAGAGLTSFITQKLRWNDNGWSADRNFFLWEGRDGTRIPTYIPFGYDHDLSASKLAQEWRQQADSAATDRVLTLYGVGDHGGGPTMQMLDRRRDTERLPTFPVLRDADPAASVEWMVQHADSVPVIHDELYFEYHRGVQTTQASTKAWNRRMEATLLAAEAAATTLRVDYPRAALGTAWQKVLFNQFHDILPGSGIGEIYQDAAADYLAADSIAQGVLRRSLRSMAMGLNTMMPAVPAISSSQAFFVFNPSSWTRSSLVTLPTGGVKNPRVISADAIELSSAVTGDSITVLLPRVPALGGAVVFVAAGPAARARPALGKYLLQNRWLQVEIDPQTGAIKRLYDRGLKRELLLPGAQANVLKTMVDTPRDWDAWNVDQTDGPWTDVDSAVVVGEVVRTQLGDELTVVRSSPGIAARQRYFLPFNEGRLDIQTTIEWHASHRMLKAFFPLAIGADSVWAEIPYGAIARPSVMRTKSDSAKFELPMQRWIDASNGKWGVSLVNNGKYGYDVRGDTLRLSLLRSPKYPDPNADMGTHRFTYSIVPHEGDWRSGATFAAADELNRPLRAVPIEQHLGAEAIVPLLQLGGRGVELGAMKLAEDGNTLIVRLVERYGEPAMAQLGVRGATAWRDVDFVERPLNAWADVTGDRIQLHLRPWQIRTIEVKLP